MFGKLIKHEWIASRKLVGIFCFAMFMSGLLSGGVLRYLTWSAAMGNGFMVEMYGIVLILSVLTIVAGCAGTMYLMVYRFFKSRFENEGYLTFTLPVTTHQQLLSSMVNTTICSALVGVVACLSVLLGVWIYLASFDSGTRQELGQGLVQAVRQTQIDAGLAGNWILGAMELVLSFFADMILLMTACTMAMLLAKKHPILMGVAVYIGGDLVISGLTNGVNQSMMTDGIRSFGSLVFSCALHGAVAVGGYFLMHHLMEKKLNLN